jgi:hypothetical protein
MTPGKTMRITKEELVRRIVDSVQDNTAVYDFDNERQVMIYTGMYKWSDGFYHDEPEEIQLGVPKITKLQPMNQEYKNGKITIRT